MNQEFCAVKEETEQVCYFDGILIEDQEICTGVVTTLTFPNAKLERGFFIVAPEAMSEAGQHFRTYGLVRLAQVHTHPTSWVGHSEYDDNNAYSLINGAISIVLPNYAQNNPSLDEAGVHLRRNGKWNQLDISQIPKILKIVPSHIDKRPKDNNTCHEQRILESPPRKSWWNIFKFW